MRRLDLSKFRNAANLSTGRHASVFSGEGMEFGGLRSYSDSDDSRSIDWKASVRSGKTLVKTYVPDREIPVWCVIDASAQMGFGAAGQTRFDQALSVFELVASSSVGSGNRVGAIAYCGKSVSRVLKPTLSHADIRRFVTILRSDFYDLRPSEMSESLPFSILAEKIRSKSVVFLISDVIPELPPSASKILHRSHLFGVRISHPFDSSPPRFGIPVVSAGGFFSRWFSKPSHPSRESGSEDSTKPVVRILSAEIPVGTDPYPPLNRLLSNPHA